MPYIFLPPTDGGSQYWQDAVANFGSLPTSDAIGAVRMTLDTFDTYYWNGSSWVLFSAPGGGDVTGPGSAVADDIAVFNGTTGKIIKDGGAKIADIQFTDEKAQDAVGGILTDTATIDFTYDDATPKITADLKDTTVTPASYGDASHVGSFTVDQQGRLTAASNVAIQIAESQVTNLVSDLAGKQATGNYITALTGDVTATGPGSVTATLANTTVTAASYGDASHVATFTVDGKGRLTAAANTAIAITSGSVSDFNEAAEDAVGGILTDTATIDFTYNDAGNQITADLKNTTVAAATYGDASHVAQIAIDAQGRATSASNVSIQIAESQVTSLTSDLAGKQPLDATLTALAAYNTNGFIVQTGADTFAGRTLQQGTGITISNPDGVAGDPTIATTITQYTDEMAEDAVGGILTDTAEVNFTYDDAGNKITADLINNSIVAARLKATATDIIFGRATAGAGAGEEIACTATGRSILDDTSVSAVRTTIGAAASGAVTASGLTMATARLLGRTTASTGAVEEISVSSSLSLSAGTLTLDPTLVALAAFNSNGILVQTAADTFTSRSIAVSGTTLGIASASGVGGNPTITTTTIIDGISSLSATGLIARTGAGTVSARTITGGTNITVTNGDGVSGNPTIAATVGAVDTQVFSASGTWTKPTGGQTWARVIVIGGGAGGGSGRRGAVSTNRFGGGGGGGGAYLDAHFLVSALPGTQSVTVGTGGAGGTAITADTTNGNPGTNGNDSLFGTVGGANINDVWILARGGLAGGGGTTTAGTAGAGAAGAQPGSSGGAGGTNAPSQGNPNAVSAADGAVMSRGGGGGGGGGGVTSGNAVGGGGGGGADWREVNAAGGNPGAAGWATATGSFYSGGGGGGGNGNGGAGRNGGKGGYYGGGGGGGGGSLNGNNSGAGGAGADGVVVVVCW